MLSAAAREVDTPGSHLPPAAAPAPRLPVPVARAGAGLGQGGQLEAGRTRVKKDDTVAQGWLRSRPDPAWITPPGFPSLVSSACPLELVGAGDSVRSLPSFCSPVLLLLKGPAPPHAPRVARMEVARETPAEWGPAGGAFVEPGLRASGQRSSARSLREGDLKSL